ncbi:MAG: PAS domain-containing protein [Pseudomonadota bacterium]
MKIRTQLQASAGVAVVVALLVAGLLLHVTRQARAGLAEQAESQLVARDVANLLSLTNEFSVYGGERVSAQWRARQVALVDTVKKALAGEATPSVHLQELHQKANELTSLFDALVEVDQSPPSPLGQRRRSLLVERLLTETQELVESRHRWALSVGEKQEEDQRRYTLLVLTAPAALLTLMLFLGVLVARRVLQPLRQLQAAVVSMHRGDWTVRCANDRPDELGDVARAVDAMARALQAQSAAQRASEHQLRLVTNNVPARIARHDIDERYTFANAHIGRAFGAAPEALLGRTLLEMKGADRYAELAPWVAQAKAGHTVSFEVQHTVDGLTFHHQYIYVPDVDEAAGCVCGFYTMTFDITARKEAELRQAASEGRLSDITDNLPALVAYLDRDHCYRFVNATYRRWLGLDPQAMIGRPVSQVLGPALHQSVNDNIQKALDGERVQWTWHSQGAGKDRHYLAEYIPDVGPDGAVRGCYALTMDITAVRQAQQDQARTERQLRAITDNLPVLIAYIDSSEHYTFVNATFKSWMGVEPQSMLGRPVSEALPSDLYDQRRDHLQRALAGQRVSFTIESVMQGTARILETIYLPDVQSDGSVAGVYALSTDITAQKVIERQLSDLARIDTLTGLPNRRQFEERMGDALKRGMRSGEALALFFLDVDRFKSINDTLGHGAGDQVLKEFGERLRVSVRGTDLAARLAGDEFVILLEGLKSEAEAALVANKVLRAVREPIVIDGVSLHVTTSIGVAYCAAPNPQSPLMECADSALYEAKHAGRDTFRVQAVLDDLTLAGPTF